MALLRSPLTLSFPIMKALVAFCSPSTILMNVFLRRRDRRVCIALPLLDADLTVLDADDPLAGAVDVEQVGGVQACRLRRVAGARLEGFEELTRVLGHGGEPSSWRHGLDREPTRGP